jgi:RND family efflux transporter MFP subunit
MFEIRRLTAARAAGLLVSFALASSAGAAAAASAEWATSVAQPASSAAIAYVGVVEALRQTVIAAQVAGAVVEIGVKVGDSVKAGQLLIRLDARAADQNAVASDAQVEVARASLAMATQDLARQKQLFKDNYISQAALERAESAFNVTQAQVSSQRAQAGSARTQTSLFAVRAPYAGVIAEVPVALGDMALPGRPLLTIYDPAALRITASVPQSVATLIGDSRLARVELPGLADPHRWPAVKPAQVLPTVDAATHTVQVRADLPARFAAATPGLFARLWLPAANATTGAAANLSVPLLAIVRRAEMTGLYVLDPNSRPVLRQVRLGRIVGDRVEILAGLSAGERVVSDPQAAARNR